MNTNETPLPEIKELPELKHFIEHTESRFFRTNEDTGATLNTLLVWNQVRRYAGLSDLKLEDMPGCSDCEATNQAAIKAGLVQKQVVRPGTSQTDLIWTKPDCTN